MHYIDSINSIGLDNIEDLHRLVALQFGNVFTVPFGTSYAHCSILKVKLKYDVKLRTPASLAVSPPVQK